MSALARGLAAAALCAGLLGLGIAVSFGGDTWSIAAALGLVAAAVLLRWLQSPLWGTRLLLGMAVLLPMDFAWGSTKMSGCFLAAGLLLALWVSRLVVLRRHVVLDASRPVVAALLFMGTAVLSFFVGQFPWFPIEGAPLRAQIGGLLIFLLSGGVFLVVAHEVTRLSELKGLTWLFLFLGAVALVLMLLPGVELSAGGVSVLTAASVGSLFFTWLVAMSVSQALWNRSLPPSIRALLIAIAAATLVRGLFVTFDWSSGWLPPLVALSMLLLFRFPRTTVSVSLIGLAPALMLTSMMWDSLMRTESWSWVTRVEAQRVVQQVIAYDPIFGLGPANYHFYAYFFPILGYHSFLSSHNNYTDLAAQNGLLGLLVFCWLAFEVICLAYSLYVRATDGFTQAYAIGALSGLVASLVAGLMADWIVPFVYNVGVVGFRSSVIFWFFAGGLVAMRRLAAPAPAPSVVAPRRTLAFTRA